MIVKMMMKQLQQSVGGGLFGEGHLAMFQDHFNEALASEIEEAGGLGLAAQMERSLNAVPGSMKSGSALRRFLPSEHSMSLHRENPTRVDPRPPREGNVPVDGRVTSGYGLRKDPFHGHLRKHAGVDIAAPHGTPIRPAAPGTVTFAGQSAGYGNLVVLQHEDGTETRYAHCAEITVQRGDAVSPSDTIATVGSSGRATGPHVHFEVRERGRSIDPELWLANHAKKSAQQTKK
jgi:murein DD-endopeptidase MepM/ murein hydrolase activator NlpD